MARSPIPSWYFALVVVRKGDRFLIVQERSGDGPWYLPAGRVEPGERLADGAARETLEESGVPVAIDGVIRVEHTPRAQGARVRVFFTGTPVDHTEPGPTEDCADARWVTLAELEDYPLRGEEVREVFEYVAAGGAVYPLSLLTHEGAPFQVPGGLQ